MKFRHRHQIFSGSLNLHIRKLNDSYFIANIDPNSLDSSENGARADHSGEVLYVVAVVFLWGLSIVLLIASYIRKNRTDNNISLYLKEIQTVQRRTRKEKILRFISLLQSTRGGTTSGGRGGSSASGSAGVAQKLGIRRVSSNSSSLSYAFCRSRSPSPTPELPQQAMIRCHQDHSEPAPLPINQQERNLLATNDALKVKRHSYGCFLPEICIESDVDLAGAESSVSDFDEAVGLVSGCPEPEETQPETSWEDEREQIITEL